MFKHNKSGYIAILAAVFMPVIMLIFYLNIHMTKRSYIRTGFDRAAQQASLEIAKKYINGVTLDNQRTYLNRIAAVSFNNAIKNQVGITKNLIPLTKKTIGYFMQPDNYFDSYPISDVNNYLQNTIKRYARFKTTYFPVSNIDPDADSVIDVMQNSASGHILKLGSGNYEKKDVYYKSTGKNSTDISIYTIDANKLRVVVDATLNGKKYSKECRVTAPKMNADIVIGIPINVASMSANNDPYGTPVWGSGYKQTPLWQIKTACRTFIKRILSCRNCAIGLIPYGGNIELPGTGYQTVSHGTYSYQNYAAVNPTMPMAESYKFRAGKDGIGLSLNTGAKKAKDITQIMYRSDLEPYLMKYMQDGTTSSELATLLYQEVSNKTKFMYNALNIIYGGAANILAGYSKKGIPTYPSPYPVYGLTEHPMNVYRYLALIVPFRDNFQRSSFLYLPIMFGMSMMKNGWQAKNSYHKTNNRKKILILIANQPDLWQPRELTYFGFSNDASYIPMIDGDKIDYEKGTLEAVEDGYQRSKIYRSSDVVYDTGKYKHSEYGPGQFLDKYHEAVAIKSDYLKDSTSGTYNIKLPQPGNVKMVVDADDTPCLIIYKHNQHSPDMRVTAITSNDGTVIDGLGRFYCYPVSNESTFFVTYSGKMCTPVIAQTELRGVEYVHSDCALQQDTECVYLCTNNSRRISMSKTDRERSGTVALKIKCIQDQNSVTQYDSLGYVNNIRAPMTTLSPKDDTASLTGIAYNATISSTGLQFMKSLGLTVICPQGKTTEIHFRGGTIGPNGDGCKYGIWNDDSVTISQTPIITKVTAKNNGEIRLPSCCVDGSYNDKPCTVTIARETKYYISEYDGMKLGEKQYVKLTDIKNKHSGAKDALNLGDSKLIKDEDQKYTLSMNDCGWVELKIFYENPNNRCPVIARLNADKVSPKEANNRSTPLKDTSDDYDYIRQDGRYYYLVRRDSAKRNKDQHSWTYFLKTQKYRLGFRENEKAGEIRDDGARWALSYANSKVLGHNEYAKLYSSKFYPIGVSEYYVYATTADVTANISDLGYLPINEPSISIKDRTKNLQIRLGYNEFYKSQSHRYMHYKLFNGPVSPPYKQNISYHKFSKINLSICRTFTRLYKGPLRPDIVFSGAYNKTYKLNHKYNVIYIPRDSISSSGGETKMSVNLLNSKIISIEWSNHLNGTEGCYGCKASDGNGAKTSSGENACYYEPIKRSKNARSNSVHGLKPFAGHATFRLSTETDGWGYDQTAPDASEVPVYLENVRTRRPRQYTALYHIIPKKYKYDYPVCTGDFTMVLANIYRFQNLNVWIDSLAKERTKHEYEFTYLNGIGRYCHICGAYNPGYDPKTGYEKEAFVVATPEEGYVARIESAECTIDVNRIMLASGYQKCTATDTNGELMDHDNTELMRSKVTPKMIKAFNDKFGNNGRIYVVHYRYNKDGFSHWQPSKWGVHKNYMAANQKELQRVLFEIYRDIQDFSEYQNAKLVD